ncbi:putative heterokaryon incompatibility protein [Botrytis fragariae]|uniref:Putative heterokaryon incompatibility protein n=1 Tax=Botrytis fragariae TaxID=1964551 RepID=A0A8H6AVG0_9HELO|nr:putative heterokaryon incompatibility protein [Botrytis fragariae]KAF5874234.1 putative heterokaryon incompatibility protein [Botrytis fragariae]
MSYLTSKDKGLDQSTTWSDWIWVEEQGYWYCHRTNAEGEEEYEYRYPDKLENPVSTPRTPQLSDAYLTFQNSAHQSSIDEASSSIDATTRAFGDVSLEMPRSVPEGTTEAFDPQVNEVIANVKYIFKSPNSGDTETLDSRYQIYAGLQQNEFWKVGRVFMVLWTEPAADLKVPEAGGTRDGSHFSTTYLGQQAYSEIRRFVVMLKGHGNSICCPIHTYSNQATLKPNLPAPLQHTIIHTTPEAPREHCYEASNGQWVYENLILDAIQVNSERTDALGVLNPLSRLNYSKVYTVEHYVRVLNIGMVASNSIATLLEQSGWSQHANSTQRPRSGLPPRKTSGQSSSHHKSRQSRRHK